MTKTAQPPAPAITRKAAQRKAQAAGMRAYSTVLRATADPVEKREVTSFFYRKAREEGKDVAAAEKVRLRMTAAIDRATGDLPAARAACREAYHDTMHALGFASKERAHPTNQPFVAVTTDMVESAIVMPAPTTPLRPSRNLPQEALCEARKHGMNAYRKVLRATADYARMQRESKAAYRKEREAGATPFEAGRVGNRVRLRIQRDTGDVPAARAAWRKAFHATLHALGFNSQPRIPFSA